MPAANDNAPPARLVPVLGTVGEDGKVTLTRPLPKKAKPFRLFPWR